MFDWLRRRRVAGHYARGRAAEAEGRYAEAEAAYRAAAALDPRHARAHNNVGAMLHMQGKLDAALEWYRKALEIDPAQPEANQNYAAIAGDAGARERAIDGYRRDIEANPNDAAALHQLGNTYAGLGRAQDALDCFDRALVLAPDMAEAHFSRSFILLQAGRYAEGWAEYEWRWRIEAFNAPARRFPQPMWDPSALRAGTVLIHGETGLGDMLQFVRYAPLVAERCARVVLECPAPLRSLLAGCEGVSEIRAQGEPLPPFDAHVPLIRLPFLFRTTLENVPWKGPYVHADPVRAAQWSPDAAKLKVGLAWSGLGTWDARQKFTTLDSLAPLAQPGVAFYSLQKGAGAEQAKRPPPGMDFRDLTDRIIDFADTAALMRGLDLVISVDTSVAHLAGAMGVPAWIMLGRVPNWRWHLARDDNPWYPGMRLFRQERDGDWAGAIERVRGELQRLAVQ